MKRMHELTKKLYASGEWSPQRGYFLLDKPLEINNIYLLVIRSSSMETNQIAFISTNEEEDDNGVSATFAESTAISTGEGYTQLTVLYNSLNHLEEPKGFLTGEDAVIYVYRLPL